MKFQGRVAEKKFREICRNWLMNDNLFLRKKKDTGREINQMNRKMTIWKETLRGKGEKKKKLNIAGDHNKRGEQTTE